MNEKIDKFGWTATTLSVIGVILNNHMSKWCFAVWLMSNIMSDKMHHKAGMRSLLTRDVIFAVLAVYGLIAWTVKGI